MMSKAYDVASRPAGGQQLAVAVCDDGLGHAFAVNAGRAETTPACGKTVTVKRPCEDEDHVCESCATAAESWAQGGQLQVRT